ncbi:MAG: hypothetical protein KA354_15720 [Phycisphaerae bacterium]|nr:hypothetical protein [Phycisphaerae bacterium]
MHSKSIVRTSRVFATSGLAAVFLGSLVGCTSPETRINLTTFDAQGQDQQHYATFTQASYRLTPGGTFELALHTTRPSSLDPTQSITQIIYLKCLWTPRPGTTYAEPSQINAKVQYAILTPPTGVRYDGSAFLSCKLDQGSGMLTGRIESGTLSARFRVGEAIEPFAFAKFTGAFTAVDNPREVVRAAQSLNAQFTAPISEEKP